MNREHSIHQKDFLKAYDELSDALFRHSFFRVSNKEVALDMVQDAFMKTWNHIVGGKIIENYKAFLYHVMNNLIIDYYRKSKSSSLDVLLDDGFDPGDTTVNIEQSAEVSLLIRSLHKLETSDREIVVMRYVDGLSIAEIANSLSESANIISVRLHRATAKLKEIIQP